MPTDKGFLHTICRESRRHITCCVKRSGAFDIKVASRMALARTAALRAAIRRKNALFYRTLHGSEVGDRFMSLIHTCGLAGADAFDYLTQLQRHAAESLSFVLLLALLPRAVAVRLSVIGDSFCFPD